MIFVFILIFLISIGFTTHKTHAETFDLTTKAELKIFQKQLNIYNESISDKLYIYEKNDRFKTENDVRVVAKKFIKSQTVIKTLCGQTCPIKPEDIIVCIA